MNWKIDQNTLIVGVLAGLISAVLMLFVLFFSAVPIFIIIITLFISVPIFIAAFGWGTFTSFIAAIIATIVASFLTGPFASVVALILFWGPACYFAWLLGLAKHNEKSGRLEWYPLTSVITRMTLFFCIIGIITGFFLIDYPGINLFAQVMADHIALQMRSMNMWNETDIMAQHAYIIKAFVLLVATSFVFLGLLSSLSSMAFSLFLARKTGKIQRPTDDWAATLRLPLIAVIIFIVTFALSLLPLPPLVSLLGSVISSTLSLVFSLSGICWLHFITRGKPHRTTILAVFYVGLCSVLFSAIVAIAALVMGVWASLQTYKPNNQSRSF